MAEVICTFFKWHVRSPQQKMAAILESLTQLALFQGVQIVYSQNPNASLSLGHN